MITEAGNNPKSPYLAFGDDSEYRDVLLYGFVICRRKDIARLEKGILAIKEEFGIPKEIPIHMTKLLSGQYRKKNHIRNFEKSQQSIFFRKIVNLLNRNSCVVRFCYTIIPDAGKLLSENSPDDEIQIVENRKAILHQMASACFVPYVENGKLVFSANDFEVFVSKDRTKVNITRQGQRKQAHFWSELLIPTSQHSSPDSYIRLKPLYQEMKDNILLQLADAVVYILAHAHSKKYNHQMFTYQAKRIKCFIRHTLVTENNQNDLGITLPKST